MFKVRVQDAAAWLRAHVGSTDSRTLVALAGLPGAGKSTVAATIAREFNAAAGEPAMMALGMDGFHLSKAALSRQPDPAAAFARRGAPWTFDPAALTERLRALRTAARPVPWPGFAHEVGDPVDAAQVVPPKVHVVLVEGLYLLLDNEAWHGVTTCFDLRCFLDVAPAIARERLIRRHRDAWGLDRAAAVRRVECNDDLNAKLVIASRERAEVFLCE